MDELKLALARRRARLEAERQDESQEQTPAQHTPELQRQLDPPPPNNQPKAPQNEETPPRATRTDPRKSLQVENSPLSSPVTTDSSSSGRRGSNVSNRIKLIQEELKKKELNAPQRSQSTPTTPKENTTSTLSTSSSEDRKQTNAVYEKLLQNRLKRGGGAPMFPQKRASSTGAVSLSFDPSNESDGRNSSCGDSERNETTPVDQKGLKSTPLEKPPLPSKTAKPPPLPAKPSTSPPSKIQSTNDFPSLNMKGVLEKKLAEGSIGVESTPQTISSTSPNFVHKPGSPLQAPLKPTILNISSSPETVNKQDLVPPGSASSTSSRQNENHSPTQSLSRSSIAQKGLNLEAILQNQISRRSSVGLGSHPEITPTSTPPHAPKELKPSIKKIRIEVGNFIKKEPQPVPQPLDRDTSEIDQMLQDRLTGKVKPPPQHAKPQLYLASESKVKPPQPRGTFSTMASLPAEQVTPLSCANLGSLSESQKNDLIQSFNVLDHDGDGLLDTDDIALLRESLQVSEEELPNQTLTFAQYVQRMKELMLFSSESNLIRDTVAPFVSGNKLNCDELKEHLLSLVASEGTELDTDSIDLFFSSFSSQVALSDFVGELST
mmetsp:Transcript_11533/g.43254  ORF Transcript_11533/g.43254 Transcript_11533/m.43254 type:complete len:605 (+) Transcript_11533:199-2013(+)